MDFLAWVYLVFIYFLLLFTFVILPAAFNISLGLRDFYVNTLLKIFEFGYRRIQEKNGLNEAASGVISQEPPTPTSPTSPTSRSKSFENFDGQFQLDDVCDYLKSGIEELVQLCGLAVQNCDDLWGKDAFQDVYVKFQAIIEDQVTNRFAAEELPSWNLLTRTNLNYHFLSARLTVIWILGFLFRYCILLPIRFTLLATGFSILFGSMAILPQIQNERLRSWLSKWSTLTAFRICARGISAVVRFHNRENMAKGGGICVANHTSPIDAILLAMDRNYALIGQMQGGIMGTIQKALLKAQDHIFFERGEMKDRMLVVKRMKEHVEDPAKNPILIFPEGTCINNTSVMMFKKGSFEVGGKIYPVAIKYDPTFGNAFWNSMQEPMAVYLMNMLTSWAIVCDIWYLPPTEIQVDENAIQFANRVKSDIAIQGGLVDLVWDGGLKRAAVSTKLIEKEQEKIAKKVN